MPVPDVSELQMREVGRIAVRESGQDVHKMIEKAGRVLAGYVMGMHGIPSL